MPCTYPATEVIPKSASKSAFINHSKSNIQDSSQGIPTSGTFNLNSSIPQVNRMLRSDIKLTIFNWNGLEVLEKHRFLCENYWTVRKVQDEAIKKYHMITTFIGCALD